MRVEHVITTGNRSGVEPVGQRVLQREGPAPDVVTPGDVGHPCRNRERGMLRHRTGGEAVPALINRN